MRVALIGADFEENLGLGMIAAVAREAGHVVGIFPFNEPDQLQALCAQVREFAPSVVGASIQFQHRAHEFLRLARSLRRAGFRGHITCGGQFPTLAFREVLSGGWGIDSVVLYEGEQTLVELLAAIGACSSPQAVPGLAVLDERRQPVRTAPRGLARDLDAHPFAARYRPHGKHGGIPFIPIMGGRGCWGACSYCSITSFYRDARRNGGGPTLRLRSPADVAAEMAELWHDAGGPSIFCFHDDNFLLPNPADTLGRVRAIRAELDKLGVGPIGIVGKCRPETLTADLARELRALGVIRLYVGVENASEGGARHLNRSKQFPAIEQALRACREAGIFVCYNLLLFEPEATVEDVRTNVAFMRANAAHPANFCRAEPYHGTPLHQRLATAGALGGSYLGWTYEIADRQTELLFRICASAFRERNFAPDGVANRHMGIGYEANVLQSFYEDAHGEIARLVRRASAVSPELMRETADFLDDAILLATSGLDDDAILRGTALLGMRVAEADARWQRAIDKLYADMEACAAGLSSAARPALRRPRSAHNAAKRAALSASLAVGGSGCFLGHSRVYDPLPEDAGVDASRDSGRDARSDGPFVADPPPYDAGYDGPPWADPVPDDAGIDAPYSGDTVPSDSGVADVPVADPAPADVSFSAERNDVQPPNPIDQWRDTAPRRSIRARDLALFDPPDVRLAAREVDGGYEVALEGAQGAVTTRWEALGALESNGTRAHWAPAGDHDHLRVAVRSAGGVAVVSLRAKKLAAARRV